MTLSFITQQTYIQIAQQILNLECLAAEIFEDSEDYKDLPNQYLPFIDFYF